MGEAKMASRHVTALAAVWLLLAISAVRSEPHDFPQPSDQGLANENNTISVSPAMLEFFHGDRRQPKVELPEALDSAEIARGSLAPPAGAGDTAEGGRRPSALLVAGVTCGVLGFVLIFAAAVGYTVYTRRSKAGSGSVSGSVSGLGLRLVRWKRGSEVTLGSA